MKVGYVIEMRDGSKVYVEADKRRMDKSPQKIVDRAVVKGLISADKALKAVKVVETTPMGDAEYVKQISAACPVCRSEDVSYDNIEVQDGRAYQEAHCQDCGFEFCDEYVLAGYHAADGGEPAGKPSSIRSKLFLMLVVGGTEPSLTPAEDEETLCRMAVEARNGNEDTSVFWMETVEGVDRPRSGWFSWEGSAGDWQAATRVPEADLEA